MAEDYRQYLDPKVLAKISRLDLQARLVVEGFISGMHQSPFHGFSVEFASHREYTPGDDTRHIDWKVQARTDRYYIKQYEEETNLKATFLLDASESMQYGRDGGLSKYQYAASTVAALAFLLLRQQDAAGIALFDDQLRSYIPAAGSNAQIKRIIHEMSTHRPREKTSLEGICHSVAETIPRRGLVCLVSDLFTDIEGVIRGLQHFRHHGHEVVVLHIMDADELEFPFQANTRFEGLEETGHLLTQPRALRESYLASVEAFCKQVKRTCVSHHMDYRLISTAEHLDAALLTFLSARVAAVRKAANRR
jgi:uncharacterized protein (DUF58 family)